MMILNRDQLNRFPHNSRYEWLVTNGIGGYAAGTVCGLLSRRYHGLLMAALDPPVGRTLLVSKMDTIATVNNRDYDLYATQWGEDRITGAGYQHLNRFYLDGTTPVWEYGVENTLLEKRIWMAREENVTYVQYTHLNGSVPLQLTLSPFVNYRDYHGSTYAGNWHMRIDPLGNESGLEVKAYHGATPIYILSKSAKIIPRHIWFYNHHMQIEAYRGLKAQEDHLLAATAQLELRPGESGSLLFATHADPELDSAVAYRELKRYESEVLARAAAQPISLHVDQRLKSILLAADQFIVNRPSRHDENGKSIIAGYPWFSDWGRDTMISLPGLTLTTGRPEIAASILQTYGHFVDQGMLPNRFPDGGEVPEYNTVDATLWYFIAIYAYVQKSNDLKLLRRLYPVLENIVEWHKKGTRYRIKMADDGLLFAGEPGIQLTWMDAKVDDWVVTPRNGKPVEINALWFNAISIMSHFSSLLGYANAEYEALAARIETGFSKFWHARLGTCYDIIDGDQPVEIALQIRPNQLLAVSLPYSPLTPEQQKQVVDLCAEHLYTPHGMRSLSPTEAPYIGRYAGDRLERDGAYHQGTVWGWLMGPFIAAHLRVYNDPIAAERYLSPLLAQVADGCIGTLAEIFDGDPPFSPRGCFAQAWTVAELLRVYELIVESRK